MSRVYNAEEWESAKFDLQRLYSKFDTHPLIVQYTPDYNIIIMHKSSWHTIHSDIMISTFSTGSVTSSAFPLINVITFS